MNISEAVVSDSEQAGHEVDAGRIDAGMTAGISRPGDYSWGVQGEKQELLFTGSGSEYFRIWIVNLCLTIATFGIYSAWAKVRRLQYFDRNTLLAGAVFNFHGNPQTILRGRVVAALVLFSYHYLFEISKAFALFLAAALMLGMPLLLRSALRFRLRNTSYRGLRFNFHGSPAGAYLTYLPMVLMFVLPGLVAVLYPRKPLWIFCATLPYLSWPWLHARIKLYQHGQFSYGTLHSDCSLRSSAFVWAYSGAALIMLGVMVAGGMTAGFTIGALKAYSPAQTDQIFLNRFWITVVVGLVAAFFGYLAYLICGPFLQVKIWNRVWPATRLPGLTIGSELPLWPYLRLQTANVLLTLLTLGLYRPFAVVRAYRFRLAYVSLSCHGFDHILAEQNVQAEHAAGDGSADFLGFDVSW